QHQQHARRVARIFLVKGDLECVEATPGTKTREHGKRFAVERKLGAMKLAFSLRTTADFLEISALFKINLERRAALAFPAGRLKREKTLQPALDIRPVINREVEFTKLGKPVPEAIELLALLLADMGREI